MQVDRSTDGNVLSIPVPMCRGGSDGNLDTTDGLGLDFNRGPLGIDSLQQKILKVTEQLKIEQTERDENLAEYLKLVNSAEKQQVARIKQVFEKKNQKAAQSIASLQKKLEQYHRRSRESENSSSSRHGTPREARELPKDNLRDVSGSGRHPCLDKIKTIGPGVSLSPPFFFSKPRDFANLIRNKFGSADNISHLKSSLEAPTPFTTEEGGGRGRSVSANMVAKPKEPSDDECSSEASVSVESSGVRAAHEPLDAPHRVAMVLEEIREFREGQTQLAEDIEGLKAQFKNDYAFITQTVQEEKYRYERLEDQLNDLSELHQNEMANLKQELASIEEKVAYQAYERARDIQEALESCQTRVSKLELQQQQQQTVQLESQDAKVLLGKTINVMLVIATVILVCVSTAAKFAAPLLRSRLHVVRTFLVVLLLGVFWRNWEHVQCAMERMLVPG